MKRGDVVKVAFIQKDKEVKKRPAVLLKEIAPHGDWITCAISSKLHKEITGTDIILDKSHMDFVSSGLIHSGLIRAAYIITIPVADIEGAIGNISQPTLETLINRLKEYISH